MGSTLNRLRGLALGAAAQRALKASDRSRGIYPSLRELVERYGGGPDLTAHELRVFSQNGEDGVLAEILRRIGTGSRTFVEFGIQDGSEGTTVFLAQVMGWSGVYLEADPDEFRDIGADPALAGRRARLAGALNQWGLRLSQRTTRSEQQIKDSRGKSERRGILIGVWDERDVPAELWSRYLGEEKP